MPFIFVQELNFRQDDEARNKQVRNPTHIRLTHLSRSECFYGD